MALAADEREDQDVAAAAKVPPDQLSRWKNGKATPKLDSIVALVAELGVSADWLLTGAGEMYSASPDAERDAFRRIAAIVDGVREVEAAGEGDDPVESEGLGGDPGPAA